MRIQRVWKAAALLAVGAAGGGAALAVASVPDSNGVIHGCVGIGQSGKPIITGPNLRIVDTSAGQTCSTVNAAGGPPSEANLAWNTIGATGPRGARGARGPAVTIAGGNTFTISGGTVITVGASHGLTINTPTITANSRAIGRLAMTLGGAPNNLPVYSWSFVGSGGSSTGGSGGAGKTGLHEIVITKTQDASSPKLQKACANGEHFKTVVLSVRKAGGAGGGAGGQYLVYKFEDVKITSYQLSSGGDRPSETITLNFTKVEYK